MQKISNHPVHILNSEGDFSPSAFIPFCFFGNKNLGKYINAFKVPVCNIFREKIWNDQLCYGIDLNLLKEENDIKYQLKDGLTLILDFNEERQFEKDVIQEEKEMKLRNHLYEEEENSVQVHLESIGEKIFKSLFSCIKLIIYPVENDKKKFFLQPFI